MCLSWGVWKWGEAEDRLGENDLFMAHGKSTTESSRAEVRDQGVQVVCKL